MTVRLCGVLWFAGAALLQGTSTPLGTCGTGSSETVEILSTGRIETGLEPVSPATSSDLFDEFSWQAVEVRREALRVDLEIQAAGEVAVRAPSIIPFDLTLLDRVTFRSLEVTKVAKLLGIDDPVMLEPQPWGKAAFAMWPPPSSSCGYTLELEWEIDDECMPRIAAERIIKRCVGSP